MNNSECQIYGHLVHLRQLLSCCQDVADTIEDNANSLVILRGEQVAEGFEDTLAAQVDNLRHLLPEMGVGRWICLQYSNYRATTG